MDKEPLVYQLIEELMFVALVKSENFISKLTKLFDLTKSENVIENIEEIELAILIKPENVYEQIDEIELVSLTIPE